MQRVWWQCLGLLLVFFLCASLASATEVQREAANITLDEAGVANVTVTVDVTTLTSQQFSYLVPYDIRDLRTTLKNGELSCMTHERAIGIQILCIPPRHTNLSITIAYETTALVTQQNGYNRFQYTRNVLEPTDQHVVQLVLPEGYGVAEQNGGAVQPEPEDIGSTGREIIISWKESFQLGDEARFEVHYESLGIFQPTNLIILGSTVVVLLSIVIYLLLKRRKERGETVVPVLQDDEKEVIAYLARHNGECEQRDIVKALPYSKAKISTLLSDLEERSIIGRERKGRVKVVHLKHDIREED